MSIDTKRCSLIILLLWSLTGNLTFPSARVAAAAQQAVSPKQTVVEELSRITEEKRLLEQQELRLKDQWQAMAHAQQQAGISNEQNEHKDAALSSSASQGESRGTIAILVLGFTLLLFVGLSVVWRRFFAVKVSGELQNEQNERDPDAAEGIENIRGIWGISQAETRSPEPNQGATSAPPPSFKDRRTALTVDKPAGRQAPANPPSALKKSKEKSATPKPVVPVKEKSATLKPVAPVPVCAITPLAEPVAPEVPHLLVVEDNVVNQKLLVRILEKMGYSADSAGDGKAALAAVARTQYALILMDCQMPEMHGFEATARIRQHEAQIGAHTWIVAVTAETSPGARELCLKAGMDEYMAKPITPQILRDILTRWAPLPADAVQDQNIPPYTSRKTSEKTSEKMSSTAPLPPPCNIPEALVHIDGDREILQEMAEVFLSECPYFLEQIQTAIGQDDGLVLASAARTLKVSVSNFVAAEVFEAAAVLEKMGMHGDLAQASAAFLHLEQTLQRLKPVLLDLKQRAA